MNVTVMRDVLKLTPRLWNWAGRKTVTNTENKLDRQWAKPEKQSNFSCKRNLSQMERKCETFEFGCRNSKENITFGSHQNMDVIRNNRETSLEV